jgi:menaquinone-dependent protoporphyrinogen IX oxidase
MIIQKHFLKTTALALILSFSSLSPVSATKVTLQKHDWIGEDDTLIDIASKGATVLQTESAIGNIGRNYSQTQLVPYREIAQVMDRDMQNVKTQVIGSDMLTYPGKFEEYEQAFLRTVQTVLNKAPLNQIPVDQYSDLAKNLPPQAFKALRSFMAKSKDRNEWALDNTLGGYFTLAQNKNGKVALMIKDLNVVLPLFKDQRLAEMDSWIPSGVVPSKLQQDTASLFSLILLNQPHKLKKGVQYRLQNQQEPLGVH